MSLFDAIEAFSPGCKIISLPATVIQATPDNTLTSWNVDDIRNNSPLKRVKVQEVKDFVCRLIGLAEALNLVEYRRTKLKIPDGWKEFECFIDVDVNSLARCF
jgi:hypothetical protein